MKELFQIKTRLILCICLSFFIYSCSEDQEEIPDISLTAALDDYITDNFSVAEPGLSIIVRQEDQIIYQANRGLAQLSGTVPITEHTQFRLASVTKPFTAIAIMKLVEEEELNLEDNLLDYLPDLPSSFEDITIEHLLTHRSGLLDYINDNTNLNALDNMTNEGLLEVIEGSGLDELQFVPGNSGDYSNTGYAFLALIIEEITDMSYPEFMKTEIFDPIGMINSFVISEDLQLGDMGDNFALSFGTDINVFGFNSLIYGPNGIVSTTHDMMLFTTALLEYDIITEESLEAMVEVKGSLQGIADYGLGWMTGQGQYWHSGKYTNPDDFWHTGGFDGYRTVLSIKPDSDIQVIILTNNGETSKDQMLEILEIIRNNPN